MKTGLLIVLISGLAASAFAAQTVPTHASALAPSKPSNPLLDPAVASSTAAVEVGPETKPQFSQYRIFVESVTFGGTDPSYRDADYTFKPQLKSGEAWSAPEPLLLGPTFKAKDLPLRSHQSVSYGLTYYFPVQVADAGQPRIEGELTLNSYASGFFPSRKLGESFKVSIDRQQLGRVIDAHGDRGSIVRLRLMSFCDFNIYETMDLTAIRKPLKADLESLGGRVFDEHGDHSLYSRPTNAIWVGAKAPEECMLMAIKTFSVKYAIPLKGVYALSDSHHSKWFFNPYGVTLGYSHEIDAKPELSRASLTQLMQPGGRAHALQ
jgi:hypothetical protein